MAPRPKQSFSKLSSSGDNQNLTCVLCCIVQHISSMSTSSGLEDSTAYYRVVSINRTDQSSVDEYQCVVQEEQGGPEASFRLPAGRFTKLMQDLQVELERHREDPLRHPTPLIFLSRQSSGDTYTYIPVPDPYLISSHSHETQQPVHEQCAL